MSTFNQKLVTYENVASAAKALIDSGKLASVRGVITMMGGGSPNAVLPLLNQWKEANNQTERQDEITLDPGIGALISRQIKAACKQAVASTQAQLDELQADSILLAKAGQATDEENVRLRVELDTALLQIQNLTGRLEAQGGELQKAHTQIEAERQSSDALRMEMVRAQTRAEAVLRLEKEIESLQAALRATEAGLSQSKTDAAVATARYEAQVERTEDCLRQRDQLLSRDPAPRT